MTNFWRPFYKCDTQNNSIDTVCENISNLCSLSWLHWHRNDTVYRNTQYLCIGDYGCYILNVDDDDINGEILRIDINTGELLNKSVIENCGHGKIAYDRKNNVLLLTVRKYGEDWSPKKAILLNPLDLSVIARIDTNFNMTFICNYDGTVYGLCDFAHGNSIPFFRFNIKNDNNVYRIERETLDINIPDFSMIAPNLETGHEQGIAFDGVNVYFIRTQPKIFYVYNTVTNTYRIYMLDGKMSGYFLGEIEGIVYYNNKLYFCTDHVIDDTKFCDIWDYALYGGTGTYTTKLESILRPYGSVYVDYVNAKPFADGSENYPFPSIEYAIYFCNNHLNATNAIHLKTLSNNALPLHGALNVTIYNDTDLPVIFYGESFDCIIISQSENAQVTLENIFETGGRVQVITNKPIILGENIVRLKLSTGANIDALAEQTITSAILTLATNSTISELLTLNNCIVLKG